MLQYQMTSLGMCQPHPMQQVRSFTVVLTPTHSILCLFIFSDTAVAHLAKFLSIQNQRHHLGKFFYTLPTFNVIVTFSLLIQWRFHATLWLYNSRQTAINTR